MIATFSATHPEVRDERVLLLAPTRRDAETTESLLQTAAIPVTCCSTFDELLLEVATGVGVVVVPEETITPANNERLAELLQAQPPWSDLPILVLAYAGASSVATGNAVKRLGNVTVLERPLRVPTLLSADRTA